MDLKFFKPAVTAQTPLLVEEVFGTVGRYHEGHTLLGYHASPRNLGHFNVFLGQGGEMQRLANQYAPFGTFYCAFRTLLPDVAGEFFKMTHNLLCQRCRGTCHGQWLGMSSLSNFCARDAEELAMDNGWV